MLDRITADEALELACKAHLGVWAERKLGFTNAALHWEWCELAMTRDRLCVVAPREHAKSQVFTVNQVAWRSIYTPGLQSYVFAQTGDQAVKLKARIDEVIDTVAPWMLEGARVKGTESVWANESRVTAAGAGKSVRGEHPDLIIGDDVLEEGSASTAHQRAAQARWWFGTVGGMAHPPTTRLVQGQEVAMPATKVHLVGTPFHRQDLLMAMRENGLYEFRRYAAEFREADLVPGTMAVEVS